MKLYPGKLLTKEDIIDLHEELNYLFNVSQETFEREKRAISDRKDIVTTMAYCNQIIKRGYW